MLAGQSAVKTANNLKQFSVYFNLVVVGEVRLMLCCMNINAELVKLLIIQKL